MTLCRHAEACVLYRSVAPSVIKRVTYADAYAYCRGSHTEMCALYEHHESGTPIRGNLLPDGTVGDYLEDETRRRRRRFLVIEDSPVFAVLASNAITSHFEDAEVVHRASFDAAAAELRGPDSYAAVVCGFGLDGNRTAHDVRTLTDAPMVVLTGRAGQIEPPIGARVVAKGAGPEALMSALRACLA